MPRNTGKTKRSDKRAVSSTPAITKEAKYLGVGAIGILLSVAVFIPGAIGVVGPFFRNILLGLLGFGGALLPLGLICFAVMVLISKQIRLPIIRSSILVWLILAWLHIILSPIGENYYTAFEYLNEVYRNSSFASGGVMGAILGNLVSFVIGRVGAVILFSAAILILLVHITGRSFVSFVERGVDTARNYYDEKRNTNYDEYDEYDNEDEEIDNTSEILKPKKTSSIKSLPKHHKGDKRDGKRADLISIDAKSPSRETDYKVLLVQEELDNANAKARGEIAPFLRTGKTRKHMNDSGVLAFEDETRREPTMPIINTHTDLRDNSPHAQEYAPEALETFESRGRYSQSEPMQADSETLHIARLRTTGQTATPHGYSVTPVHTSHQDYSQHEEDYSIEDNDTVVDYSEDTSPLVVRGLVDDNPTATPAYDYNYEGTPVEYDEYAHIPSSTTIPTPPQKPAEPTYENFVLPSLDLLTKNEKSHIGAESRTQVMENSRILEETLRSFRIEARVVEVSVGPTVTRYDLAPGPGVKVSSIANLSNDLALSLAAQGIRIEAPIPGKSAVGIEIPNKDPQGVFLREIIENDRFSNFKSKLAFAVGKDIAGNPVVADVADMPHLLIAGATGAGKSVCINTLIASVLYKARPDEVKLLMIDPKVVELSVYNGIPHLLIPVVTDPKKASGALNWAVQEMESRYNSFAETGCRDLKGYNQSLSTNGQQPLPQIVIIIDELADLMMTAKGEVEEAICRLAQKARAAGIHLIVATQRPSVDVITGLIKANIPSRLAFAVSSGTDSRTVLDMQGAEKLLGRGDMLFLPRGQNKPIRVQGGFISDGEVENLVAFLKAQAPVEHTTEMIQQITMPGKTKVDGPVDEFFHDAVDFLLTKGKASTSMLQRQFRIGYNRASRLMDDLEMRGIVGPEDGVKPRKVTITREEYGEIYGG